MREITIIADATCDLNEELQEKYNIVTVPAHIIMPDGRDIKSSFDWADFGGRENFYSELKKNPDGFKTSPANVAEFREVLEKYAAAEHDILVMTISGGISGAIDFASAAKKEVLEKYPDTVIECFDTRRFGPGFGLMAVYASTLRSEGKSFDEILSLLEQNKSRFHQAGWLDDLSFVAKKGRITHPKAFFGTLAGVKPIGEFDSNGLTTVIGKFKGAKNTYAALLHYMEKTVENPEDQIIYIAQTNRLPHAEEYKRLIEEKFRPREVLINDVFPPCGINIGPGLMAAYYIGKPISADLSEEKKIIDDYCEEKK